MKERGFLLFLIFSLALTAFLAGYIMLGYETDNKTQSGAGTILDKFDDPELKNAKQETSQNSPFLLSDRSVVSVTNSLGGAEVMYFEKNTGKLFEADLVTRAEQTLSNTLLPNFMSAIWSPNKKEVISAFYHPGGIRHRYHSYETNKTVDLDLNIKSVAFSPDGKLIAYYYYNSLNLNEPGRIGISEPDGTYFKKLIDTRIRDLKISWPSQEYIVFKTPSSDIFLLDLRGDLKKLSEAEAESNQEISLELTTPDSKCVRSIDSVHTFCALPKSPSADEIYQINSTDGSRRLITELPMLAKNLLLSNLEDYLLFTSVGNEKLYALKIPD